jgi:hypothetical protein
MAFSIIQRDFDSGYICPRPFDLSGNIKFSRDKLLSWTNDVVTDGRSYLRLQPAYKYIDDGLSLVNGDLENVPNAALSDYTAEMTVRNLKELVAAQTNIRVIPAFKTEIPEFEKQQDILNKSFMGWQNGTFFDRRLRKGWQYASATGTGYIGLRYDAHYWRKGKGDIVCDAYGPLDVLPIGMGRQHDLQKAYAVALRVETPLHEAWRLFPTYADKIKASRENAKGRGTVTSRAVKFASAALRRFGAGLTNEHEAAPWEMVDIYYIYVDDDSVNNTGQPMAMGEVGTSWYYTVPYVGQDLKVGETKAGQPITRKAVFEDCYLYPNKRLVIATDDVVLNPDPITQVSPYWHSRVPVVQLRADDWPWTFLGFPVTRGGLNLEKNSNKVMRGMIDAMNARLSPPRAFDRNAVSQGLMRAMDTRVPNQMVGMDFTFGSDSPVRPFLPVNHYEFPAFYSEVIQQIEQRMTHQMGVADAAAMARARQLPSGDSVEKIMESLGPLIKDMSRNMEESIRGIGEIWKSNFFQFYTAKRRMQLLGPDGLSEEDFDFDPGNLIPNSETVVEMKQMGVAEGVPYFDRAKWHKDNFTFSVTPYSLHELNSMTRRLFILQLSKAGFPLDWWTMADMFDVKNFGPVPNFEDPETGEQRPAQTVLERWTCQMEMMAHIQAANQQQQGGPAHAGKKGPGRPGTGAQPPSLEQKSTDAGTRSTIRESKR